MAQITVTKKEDVDRKWAFGVVVKDDAGKTAHTVLLKEGYFQRITGGVISPEEFIEKSFEFLIEREPKEAILQEFDLEIISQYFPEYEDEFRKK